LDGNAISPSRWSFLSVLRLVRRSRANRPLRASEKVTPVDAHLFANLVAGRFQGIPKDTKGVRGAARRRGSRIEGDRIAAETRLYPYVSIRSDRSHSIALVDPSESKLAKFGILINLFVDISVGITSGIARYQSSTGRKQSRSERERGGESRWESGGKIGEGGGRGV